MTPERELRDLELRIEQWIEKAIGPESLKVWHSLAATPVLTGAPDCCLACGGTGKATTAPTPAPPTDEEAKRLAYNKLNRERGGTLGPYAPPRNPQQTTETDKVTSRTQELIDDIAQAINRVSGENGSNTPDFILAEYLVRCLKAFDITSRTREKWYGKSLSIGGEVAAPRAAGVRAEEEK